MALSGLAWVRVGRGRATIPGPITFHRPDGCVPTHFRPGDCMIYRKQKLCTLSRLANGDSLARHTGPSVGQVEVTAPTREEALTKMCDELQYRIEWCPCTGVSDDFVELQVREEGGRP